MELVSGCVECGLAEPESLASLGGSAPGVVDGILSGIMRQSGCGEEHQLTRFGVIEMPQHHKLQCRSRGSGCTDHQSGQGGWGNKPGRRLYKDASTK